jgi:hypothetical protein
VSEAQQHLLQAGYRPADLSISLDSAGSPFAGASDVDWRQPQTTLQMPPAEVVDVVRDYWYYTKRPTNVYLVVDTSGSMEGSKLTAAKGALKAFLSQIRGDRDRVGIIEFGSGIKDYALLAALDDPTRQASRRHDRPHGSLRRHRADRCGPCRRRHTTGREPARRHQRRRGDDRRSGERKFPRSLRSSGAGA